MSISNIVSNCKIPAAIAAAVAIVVASHAYAANQSQLSQSINEGIKSIDIVDGSGVSVASPAVSFGSLSFSFDTQDGTATLGTASQKIRVYNPTSGATWTASIAASSPTDSWTGGGGNYDFNDSSGYTDGADADNFGGQLSVNPSGGSLAGVGGCATTNVSLGANSSFVQGTTDSITVASAAAGAPTFCRFEATNIGLSQKIPASQAAGSYTLNLVLSIL